MKKFMLVLLSLIALIAISGCDKKNGDDKLDAPQNVAVSNDIVTWDAVDGATSYRVIVGENSYTTTATTFDLSTVSINSGTFDIIVIAMKGETVSNPSTSVEYIISFDSNSLFEKLLKMVNPNFVPNMTQTDFTTEYEYQNYMSMSLVMNSIASSMTTTSLSENEAYTMIEDVYRMPEKLGQTVTVTDIITEINNIDSYGMDSNDFANVVVNLLMVLMDMQEVTMTMAYDEQNTYFLQVQADYQSKYSAVDFSSLRQMFNTYVDSYTAEYNEFFNLETNLQEKANFAYWGYYNVLNDVNYGMYYGDNDNLYYELFYHIFSRVQAENPTLFQNLMNYNHPFNDYFDFITETINLQEQYQYLKETENKVAMMSSFNDTMVENEALFKDVFNELTTFLKNFYEAIPPTVFTQLESIDVALEIAEVVVIKDELINVLIATLPQEDTFAKFLNLMAIVEQSLTGVESTYTTDELTSIAIVERASIDLLLNILLHVDTTDVVTVMTLSNNLYEVVTIVDEYYQYEETYINYDVLFEMISYVMNFVDEALTVNQIKVTYLETQMNTTNFLSAQEKSFQLMVDSLENNEQYPQEVVSMIIDLEANKEAIFAAIELLEPLAMDFFEEFSMTNGKAIADLIIFLQDEHEMTEAFYTELENLVFGIRNYHDIIFSLNSVTNIEIVLNAFKVPVKYALMSEMVLPLDFDAFYQRIVPTIASILYDIVVIENDVFTKLDEQELAMMINSNVWQITHPSLLYSVVFVIALDNALTLSNKEILLECITNFFDLVLKDSYILTIANLTTNQVDQMRMQMFDYYDALFDELTVLADLDFANLTVENIEAIITYPNRLFQFFG